MAASPPVPVLPQNSRYARHALIPGWRQAELHQATVVVVGIGALGNEVARILAMTGVGRLRICDSDTVSASNLSRCVLFRQADVGRLKVAAAADALADLAPDVEVVARPAPLDSGVGLAELREATLVISCLDSIAARVQLAGRCGLVGIGWLDGGTHQWGGEVRRYDSAGACYGCLVGASGRAVRDDPVSCQDLAVPAEVGASAPVSAVIGAWLATTAVRLLCRLPLAADGLAVDADTGVHRLLVNGRRAPDCPLHYRIPEAQTARTRLSHDATTGQVLELVAADEDVMTWRGFAPPDRRLHTAGSLPVTTTFLRRARPEDRLCDLGVAPREILAVVDRVTAQLHRYLELAA